MYVIAGVTGHTGTATANALLAANERIRVIVRKAAAAKAWADRGAEVALADLSDASALTEALRNADGAFLLNPPAYTAEDPFACAATQGETFAKAVAGSGVKRALARQDTAPTGV